MAASASIWHDDPAWSSEDFWFLMAYRLSHGFYLIVMDSYKRRWHVTGGFHLGP